MRRITVVLAALFMLLSSGVSVWALDHPKPKSSSLAFTVTGLRAYWWGIVPSGLDLKLDYWTPPLINGLDTIIEMTAGSGYQLETYYRETNKSPYTNPNYATMPGGNIAHFDRIQAISDLGIRQGILFNPAQHRNLLEGFLFYRFHFDHYAEPPNTTGSLILQSRFPDSHGILSNSLLGGLDYNTLAYDKVHKTYQGIYAETSVEWAPGGFFNGYGNADFVRWNLSGKLFRTLYTSATPAGMNRFSLYAGDYFSADYSTGPSIPIYVQQSFGGRSFRFGLGGAVRGFETGAWDTRFKAVNSIEVRAVGPAIILPSIAPGLYTFFDSGYYNHYFESPTQPLPGFLASWGVGAYLVSLDLANVTGWIAFPLYGQRIDNSKYNISFDFSLHF